MKNKAWFISILLLVLVSALTYLPLVRHFGYTHDDWYLTPTAHAEGAGIFYEIFSVDRPGRVLVMIPAYKLFGENPLYYDLSAYLFRVLGALALLWCLTVLWPAQRMTIIGISLLFLIYPGFLSQPNGIDYQSYIVGLAAALASVGCTLQAITSMNRPRKYFFHLISIPLAWLYLGQMEWFIGFEVFRWASVFLLSARKDGSFLQRIWRAIQTAHPSLLGPGIFLFWRIFLFHSVRGATDVDLQFSQFRLYPLQTMYHWTIQVLQDSLDVTLSAWFTPLLQLTQYIQYWSIFITIITAGFILFIISKLKQDAAQNKAFKHEALLTGLIPILGGLPPIAMVNRDVSFPFYSRYSLVSSVGVAILLTALLMSLNQNILRYGIMAGLCSIAMLTHHANAVKYTGETASIRNFWWQVSWRVPQFAKNSILVALYPDVVIEEDYFVWGPASLICYPDKQNPKAIQPGLYAALANNSTLTKVQKHEGQEFVNRKNIITHKNYRNIIILTQPSLSSCVHVIDGNHPEYPSYDSGLIRSLGLYSEIDHDSQMKNLTHRRKLFLAPNLYTDGAITMNKPIWHVSAVTGPRS